MISLVRANIEHSPHPGVSVLLHVPDKATGCGTFYRCTMPALLNLIGQKFGELTVISKATIRSTNGRTYWNCRCVCGKEITTTAAKLKRGTRFSCNSSEHTIKPEPGLRFGCLTVVEVVDGTIRFGDAVYGARVRASCICGSEWRGRYSQLRKGNISSCGCLPTGSAPGSDRQLPAMRGVLKGYIRHAKRRNLVWELTEEQFRTLTSSCCFYCGSLPSKVARSKAKAFYHWNGIDRLDNLLGYTIANTATACSTCNLAKKEMSVEEFLSHIEKIHNHQLTKIREG